MFTVEKEELEQLGVEIAAHETRQQPELWQETVTLYHENQITLKNFLKEVQTKAQGKRTRVIFTGTGTSQYANDTAVPYPRVHSDIQAFSLESIGTTDIAVESEDYLIKDEPTLLVPFARSGNSPESLAAAGVANQVVEAIHHLTITCAGEGQLTQVSQKEENSFLSLIPTRSNDDGLVITGNLPCVTLGTLLLFDQTASKQEQDYVTALIKLDEEVLPREEELDETVNFDFERIVYVDSGSLAGLIREAQLKILELAADKVTTIFDSFMGLHHGPKSFVNEETIMSDFINNTPCTRDYDLDILEEVHGDEIAAGVSATAQPGKRSFSGSTIEYSTETALLPDDYLALVDIMVA